MAGVVSGGGDVSLGSEACLTQNQPEATRKLFCGQKAEVTQVLAKEWRQLATATTKSRNCITSPNNSKDTN